MSRALVLAGGGVTGIAWELGVLLGLRDEGVDLLAADLVVGTSAGAAAGAQALAPIDLAELYDRQLSPVHAEIPAQLDLQQLAVIFGEMAGGAMPDQAGRARIGALAVAADTVTEAQRRAVIEARLPSHDWPATPLAITAVDAADGSFVVFDAASGVSLVDAVTASCAVPGVWPPVTIGDRRYVDGGIRSTANADLAAAHDRIVVLAPLTGPASAMLEAELAELRRTTDVVLLEADDAATAAMGPNPLDPDFRPAAAEAGRRQGRAAAGALR